LVTFIHQAPVRAQELGSRQAATKFDEYGRIHGEDHSARLDNFAIQMQNQVSAKACVVVYGPEGEGTSVNQLNLDLIRNYLVNIHGIADSRIKTVYGGRNTDLAEPKIELWIVPRGAAFPELKKNETNIEKFKGKFSDEKAWDVVTTMDGEDFGPPVENVVDASFADMLSQQKTSAAYIVAYNGADATPGAWRRVAQAEVDALKYYKVDEGRLKIIFGGNAKETRVQLWILPADAPAPVKDDGAEKAPGKAIQVGTFSDEELGDSKNERATFGRLTEVLREFPELRVCLIVTIGTWSQEVESEEPVVESEQPATTTEPEEPDLLPQTTPADLTVLVEKWKNELATAHKISGDRLTILFRTSPDYTGQLIDAWVVPPNQPLPDPNAKDEDPPDEPPANEGVKPPEVIKPNRIQ
jgi:hypothetical protein